MEPKTIYDERVLLDRYGILQYFRYDHLPPALQEVSKAYAELAWREAAAGKAPAEVAAGLRKLLEAKDCFVRARLS